MELENLQEENFTVLEEFVCEIYGYKKIKDINMARVASFMKAYKISAKEEILNIGKNFEGSALPPCKSELRQHLLRTSYISQLWSHAFLPIPTLSSPTDFGWQEVDRKYIFKWFEGEQMPKIENITNENEEIEGIQLYTY